MAGRDVGRISRFLSENGGSTRASEKKRVERAEALTRLQLLLLSDPAYAALYRETEKTLRDAQTRLDEMLDAVARATEEAQERLNGKLSDTARAEEEARLEALTELESDIRTGQADIGDMQLRMQDEDEPVTSDELEGYMDRADKLVSDIKERVNKIAPSEEASFEPDSRQPVAGLTIPEL